MPQTAPMHPPPPPLIKHTYMEIGFNDPRVSPPPFLFPCSATVSSVTAITHPYPCTPTNYIATTGFDIICMSRITLIHVNTLFRVVRYVFHTKE